jgi:hypothetical protein
MTMDPTNPRYPDQRDPNRPDYDRLADRSEGVGPILAVVALAAMIIVGLIYLMQSPTDSPSRVTSQGPTATSPTPVPPKPAEPVK